MPFHRFYCSPNLYTKEEKQAIAQAITKFYSKLPPFLVLVNFIDVDKDSFYVGGEPNDHYLRINVQHSANPVQGYVDILYCATISRPWVEAYEKVIEPFTKGKGIGWELQMTNDDPTFWNANGMHVPPFLSEDFMKWKELNRPVEWEHAVETKAGGLNSGET
ncbi:putative oxalocrotonate tautomerase [Lentinula raphanica]|uniref:Oxalocrotonate tautomerase n=1 Tax=Lentinula raphanica TaxID=153919 RepID=A0AA38PEI2_9AGAR|nr:putative oxalocrotonate tautomerase [Lentinula raphanica]